jgi:quercetin dioxygenase-like cupin family protein
MGWRAVHLDDVEGIAWHGTELRWHPLRRALGAHMVGLAAFSAERTGQQVVEPHDEDSHGRGHQEVYVVVRGRALFTLDGEELDAPTGTFVMVEPFVRREAVALDPDTAVLAIGGPPTFEPSGSEWIERARPLVRSDPARARQVLDELRSEQPSSPALAIGEAMYAVGQGNEDVARAELRAILERDPSLREPLLMDPDLAPLLPD